MEGELPDWMARTELLLGEHKVALLRKAHVLVVGLGGVGGWASEILVRSGIGELTLVDADKVAPSNINRQIAALRSTVGAAKAEVIASRLRDINPAVKLHVHVTFLRDEAIGELLDAAPYSFVLDAIDSISPKAFLLAFAHRRKLPVVSAMGAGAKSDPSAICVDDIAKSHSCTLARVIRKRLRSMGINKGIRVVYSSELPDKEAVMPIEGEPCKRSTAGTVAYMPALIGIRAAAEIIRAIGAAGTEVGGVQN